MKVLVFLGLGLAAILALFGGEKIYIGLGVLVLIAFIFLTR